MKKKELEYGGLFLKNERNADRYFAYCMLVTIGVSFLMWLFNVVGFFIVDDRTMNIAMVAGIICFIIPPVLVLVLKIEGWGVKYASMFCFLIGVFAMSSVLTRHLLLGWAAPLVLSLHYYSPKFTLSTLISTLVIMLAASYAGMYVGIWDRNLLELNGGKEVASIAERIELINTTVANGNNLFRREFLFYYLPRAFILCVIYAVCATLSKRTHRLLTEQGVIVGERERIGAELDIATHIQQSMLPCLFPAFPERKEFDIYATMTPAKEVGGDFYDFFMVDDSHLAVVMADVSGKGVPAALFMVIGKTLIKDHTRPDRELGEVFSEVNRILCEGNSQGLFITAFEGVLDLKTGRFTFVNAGHEMPFVCSNGGDFKPYKIRPGFVLAGMDDMVYRAGEMTLGEGDMLFQYTDGVTEATNAKNELYGMQRLEAVLNANKGKSVSEILPAIKADIDSFVGDAPQFDDITMLCVQLRKLMEEDDGK